MSSNPREPREQANNEPSLLLTPEKNEMVFTALGARHIMSCS